MSDICVGSAIAGNGCMKCSACKAELAEPATPSEDGGDSVQVVAFLMKPDFCEPYVSLHRDSQTSALCEPLMTVAQHERIVGAYRVALIQARSETPVMIDAQPASQVGGDDDHLHGHPRYEHDSRDEIELFLRDAYAAGANAAHSRSLTTALDYAARHAPKLRAALAPAAVVMPERKTRDPIDWDECSREMATDDAQFCGFNAALDEVARLNRRAIPEGLLEQICDNNFFGSAAIDELRALLGKDGE